MRIDTSRHPWMSDDIDMLRAQVRRFAAAEIPHRLEHWRNQGHVDSNFWEKLGGMGLLLPEIPESYGGAGGTLAHQLVVTEELTRHEGPAANSMIHSVAAHYLLDCGTEEQKRRWLPKLCSGEWLCGIAMTEPGCGSDLQAVRTRATRDGDHYTINGTKTFITNGYCAGLMIVVAKTDAATGSRGFSLFVVETRNQPRYKVGRMLDKIGMKISDTCELSFEDMRVPANQLLGGVEGRGFGQLMTQLPYERMLIAVGACSAIERALELTVDYAKQRKAFGQTIFEFQATRHKLAELATTAHVVRTFVNDCVQRLMEGQLTPEAAYMAKWWCTEQQCRVVDDCVQLFGGYGYMNEYPIARFYADARVQKIYGGANEIMKELIARKL